MRPAYRLVNEQVSRGVASFYYFNELAPPQPTPMKIVVCSTSRIKLAAAQEAFDLLNLVHNDLTFEGVDVPSGVPDQPNGVGKIHEGAVNRLESGQRLRPDADVWISMENGLGELAEGLWIDAAIVKVVIAETKSTGTATTVGVEVPTSLVREALDSETTMGRVLAGRMGSTKAEDYADPHAELTGGRKTRVGLLSEAIHTAYGIAERK